MKKGFTLVELSIILVIMALITGGVLAGKELIDQAKINKQVRQIEEINVAVSTFKLQYHCLPGDCPNATSFFTSATQPEKVTNGNGDDIINSWYGRDYSLVTGPNTFNSWRGWPQNWEAEWAGVFDHLAAAQLYPFKQYDETITATDAPGIGYPASFLTVPGGTQYVNVNNAQSGIGVGFEPEMVFGSSGHYIRLSMCSSILFGAPQPNMQRCGQSVAQASALDTKMDDGKPYSGKVSVTGSSDYIYQPPSDCGNTTTNTYKVSTPSNVCPVRVRAKF